MMYSKTNSGTVLIIDPQHGKTRSLNIKAKFILKLHYYIAAAVLIITTLAYFTVSLYNQVNKNEEEKQHLIVKISTLKSKIPTAADTIKSETYVQSIESKLKNINEYLRRRGVRGYTNIAVGGEEGASSKLTPDEHYQLFEDYLEKTFRSLINTPMGPPCPIIITSSFGYRNDPFNSSRADFHPGLDIRGNKGDPVRCTAQGTVIFAGRNGGYGNCVKIAHKNGFETLYGHLSVLKVKKGDKVNANQVIGLIGSTGHSTGNHLHYEVRKNDKPINPTNFLSLN